MAPLEVTSRDSANLGLTCNVEEILGARLGLYLWITFFFFFGK